MRPIKLASLLALIVLPSIHAQEARFFRVAGPVATTITAFTADGYVTWTNAPTNATFTVQTAASLGGPSNWMDYIQVPATNPVTTHRLYDPNPPSGMAFIPAGSFTMGNCMATNEGHGDELPLHTVYVSSFYMDRYEVRKALWDEVYQWATNHSYSFDFVNSGQGKATTHPAQNMTWYDCVKWCNARSEKEGKMPAYYTNTAQTVVYRTGAVDLATNWVNWTTGYRLPTEAEWEKAGRGGAGGHRFSWSDTDTITHSQANYFGLPIPLKPPFELGYDGYDTNYSGGGTPYTSPVGSFAPNGYGLYDAVGNVWEWCWDWYGSYGSASQTDPRGLGSSTVRVIRGGSWGAFSPDCCLSVRGRRIPTVRVDFIGFRSVLPSQ